MSLACFSCTCTSSVGCRHQPAGARACVYECVKHVIGACNANNLAGHINTGHYSSLLLAYKFAQSPLVAKVLKAAPFFLALQCFQSLFVTFLFVCLCPPQCLVQTTDAHSILLNTPCLRLLPHPVCEDCFLHNSTFNGAASGCTPPPQLLRQNIIGASGAAAYT